METYSLYSQAPLYWGLQLPGCCDGSKSPVRWEPPQPPGGCWLSTASWASSWPPPPPCTCRSVSTGWRRMMGQRRPFPPCCWVETRRTLPLSLCLRELSAVMQLNPSQTSGKMMTWFLLVNIVFLLHLNDNVCGRGVSLHPNFSWTFTQFHWQLLCPGLQRLAATWWPPRPRYWCVVAGRTCSPSPQTAGDTALTSSTGPRRIHCP